MSWPSQALIDLLGIEHPIIQAPMAGASTPALAAAVSNAGALGGTLSQDELREVIRAIRRKTNKPFIVNLYLDRTERYAGASGHEDALKMALAPAHAELQAGEVPDPIIAQGSEAGGHRGTFAAPAGQSVIGTIALVPQIVDAVSVPVIAAGGIMDGRGIAAALMLGASGVQMGTAFVACPETAVNPAYVKRLLAADSGDAILTDVDSGRPARLLRNKLVSLLEQYRGHRLAFPEQLSMTRNLRKVAFATNNAEFFPMFAGQGVTLARAARC